MWALHKLRHAIFDQFLPPLPVTDYHIKFQVALFCHIGRLHAFFYMFNKNVRNITLIVFAPSNCHTFLDNLNPPRA